MKMNINLEMSPQDAWNLIRKCAYHDVDVETMLNTSVQDLIGGSQRNGSDEYDCANQWFDRCWIGFKHSKTFLTFLLQYGCINRAVLTWNDIESAKEDLANYVMNPTEEVALEDMKAEVTWYQEQFNILWNEYLEEFDMTDKGLDQENEMLNVLNWWRTNYRFYEEA